MLLMTGGIARRDRSAADGKPWVWWIWHPRDSASALQIPAMNCGPLSDVMSDGTPNLATQFSANALPTVAASVCAIGMASGHLVNWSMTVSKCVWPFEAGNGPTRSTWTCAKRAAGFSNLCSGARWCLCTFAVWHPMHARVQSRTSLAIPCHTNRLVMIFTDAFVTGCDSPWTNSKTSLRIPAGTSGLVTPVDMLHSNLKLSTSTSSQRKDVTAVLYAEISGSCFWSSAILQ